MSLNTMARRMSLEVPGLSDAYAATLLGEALNRIHDTQMWSYQLKESGWLTPGLLFGTGPGNSAGKVTFTPYSDKVIGDTAASAAWAAYAGNPPLTSFQIRSPYYSLYSIVGYDTTSNAPFGTITLDRPWMEPGGAGKAYMIYQAYFPAPVDDFKRFFAARDTSDGSTMDFWTMGQPDLAVVDPQRLQFDNPVYIVPFQTDARVGSSTLGSMLYELWPHPLTVLPYSFQYLRRGPQLSSPADTVPVPLTEEAVLWKAKEAAYMWKEAQKGENVERGSGADYRFLAQAADAQYKMALKQCKDRDRDIVDLYFARMQGETPSGGNNGYANINSTLNIGRL